MKADNNTRLIIYNNSKLPLRVTSMNCEQPVRDEYKVKRRASIELKPGRYNVAFYYKSAELELESNLDENLNISHIHSQSNANHLGKLIEINNPDEPVVITCNNLN